MRAIPSRSGVRARNPNSSSAREASSERRGWPFGIDVSQVMRPSKPTAAPRERRLEEKRRRGETKRLRRPPG